MAEVVEKRRRRREAKMSGLPEGRCIVVVGGDVWWDGRVEKREGEGEGEGEREKKDKRAGE